MIRTYKRTYGRLALWIGGLCAAAGTAHALPSDDYAALAQLFGEPVTTSVTGSPQRASEVPATMIIITPEEIRRSGARDVPGVLRHVAGVDVLQWTTSHTDIAVRGYNQAFSPRLLVLVDGRQVYADYYGFTPWASLPIQLEDIRQIEIVKGPSGALFGFNAVGGVINIITYDPLHTERRAASTQFGTQSSREARGVTTLPLGTFGGLRLSAGKRQGDDFKTPVEPADLGARRGDRAEAVDLDARFALSDTVEMGIEATYSSAAESQMAPTYSLSHGDYDTRSIKTTWSADTHFGLVQGSLYRNTILGNAFEGAGAEPLLRFDNDLTVAHLKDVFKIGTRHVVRVSIEYRKSSMETTPVGGADVRYETTSVGAMWNWHLRDRLSLTNAVRVDDWSLGRSGPIPASFALLGLTDASWDRSLRPVSFNSGLVFQTAGAGTIRLMVGRAQQLPNLFSLGGDLFDFGGVYYAGVPSLDPAEVTTYEVAWEKALAPSGVELRASLFHGHSAHVLGLSANIGSSTTTGVELSAEGPIGDRWRWSASYTPQRIDDDFGDSWPLAVTLTNFEDTAPRHVANAHIAWSSGPWEADGFLRYESSFEGVRVPTPSTGVYPAVLVPIPRHVVIDARLGYRFTPRTTLAISGENLGHRRERQTSGPEVERRLSLSFSYAL